MPRCDAASRRGSCQCPAIETDQRFLTHRSPGSGQLIEVQTTPDSSGFGAVAFGDGARSWPP